MKVMFLVWTNTGHFIGTVMAHNRKEARQIASVELKDALDEGETVGRVQAG
jgi:hypothetical protein